MGSWRRQRDLDDQSRRSFARKPPNQFWQPTVPSWEKKFCSTVGSVPWWKLLDTKKYMHLYENVVQWNDSAGEEAFFNAKKRFWAQINGLPCDISLPDPNENIDEVDWESPVDPELILDLDRDPEVVEEEQNGGCGKKTNLLLFYDQSAPVIGWGDDVEEDLQKKDTRWGDAEEDLQSKGWDDENCWGSNNHNNWNINENVGGNWESSNQKREDAYTFGYNKVSSFHGNNDKQRDRGGWRNGRGIRRDNFAYEQSRWIGTH